LSKQDWEQKRGRTYTMMLLIGMCTSLTKNPMNPIMANPIAVAITVRWNSVVGPGSTQHKTTKQSTVDSVRYETNNKGSTKPFAS
jgi:hypothetical protein